LLKKLIFLFFIVILCAFIACSQEKKDIVYECQVNCGGFPTEAIVMKAYSDAVDVIWRYRFRIRVWQDGQMQFLSPEYNYQTFDYIKDFSWDGTATPVDGETYVYAMTNGKTITVSRTKDFLAVNYNGIYNLVARCAISTNTSGDKFELFNSKYKHENILHVYPFNDCGP